MGAIASKVAQGLVGGMEGKVGALIFDEIFPPGAPSYFGQEYAEITKFIHQEITQNAINEVDGEVNGLKDWIKNTYTPRKEDKSVPKKELYDMLSPQESNLTIRAIGVLQQPDFAEPGFTVFMLAAGMHLAILQELAYVDPTTSDPHKSSYIQSIKQYAQEYSDYATKMYGSIAGKREAYIQLYTHLQPEGPGGEVVYYAWWTDGLTGQQGEKVYTYNTSRTPGHWVPISREECKQEAQDDMQGHIEDVKSTLNAQLFHSAISDWSKLTTQPLPN